jgi:ribosome-binding ATPase YchF (GTP1/OBG family)
MNNELLSSVENFVKVALDEISTLRAALETQQEKQAAEKLAVSKTVEQSLRKAAEAMYSSDFLNDEDEKSVFVKRAKEDPNFLARVVERVCQAADVSYMGKIASVKASPATDDPVMRRAFGYDSVGSFLMDEA